MARASMFPRASSVENVIRAEISVCDGIKDRKKIPERGDAHKTLEKS